MPNATEPRTSLRLAAGLALGVVVSLGLARFAYSLVLPSMRDDLGWSNAQAGTMNTVNAAGYLVGAIASALAYKRYGVRAGFIAGMALATLAVSGAALTSSYGAQLALRLVTGVASALTFIGGGALTAQLGRRDPERGGALLAVYVAGAGIGVVLSGLVVQPILATGGGAWRGAWLALGALCLLATLLVVPTLRRVAEPGRAAPGEWSWRLLTRSPRLAVPAVAYLLFGAGYIAYVTFVVAYLHDHGTSALGITVFWSTFGLAVLAGVPLWGRLLDRLSAGRCLALMNLVLVVGALVPLLGGSPAAGLASAVLFGSAFMNVPAGMVHIARTRLPEPAWTGAIASFTVAFALGQVGGPALAGVLSDRAGGTGAGLALAAGILAVSAAAYLAGERWAPG